MNTYVYLWPFLVELFVEMFQTKVVEKIKTHILCLITLFSENRTIYKIMPKNIVVMLFFFHCNSGYVN
jgi:hypothetical protein